MALRKTTNLVVPEDLKLSRAEAKSGFMYIYRGGYRQPGPLFMARLWAAVMLPTIERDPSFGKDNKSFRTFAEKIREQTPAGYLQVKKVIGQDPHFEISVPLCSFSAYSFSAMATFLGTICKNLDSGVMADAEHVKNTLVGPIEANKGEVVASVYTKEQIITAVSGINSDAKLALGECLINITVKSLGSHSVVFLNLRIEKNQAQQLTTTPWMEIRNIDMYPLMLSWVTGSFGYTESVPTASFPISRIARTLPAIQEGQARVDENGISIGNKGTAYYLPKHLDNTSRYEAEFAKVGEQEDGSFTVINFGAAAKMIEIGQKVTAKLPPNIPVLIDWINNKYAYTQGNGIMAVLDLVRFRAAEATHIATIMKRTELTVKSLSQFETLAEVSNYRPTLSLSKEDWEAVNKEYPTQAAGNKQLQMLFETPLNVLEYFAVASKIYMQLLGLPSVLLCEISINESPLLRPLARYFKGAHSAILSNLDVVYSKYSVQYVTQVFALITLVAKYGDNFAEIESLDAESRKAAINQGVKPDWEVPSIPLLSDRIFFLPHQEKVRNLLKDSPRFAILPVQAGGGKSVLAITDVLLEIKANKSQPYLILCPPHLVAQYVKEIVFFTSGQLNAIPINSYALRHNGFDRLQKMLETAPRNTVVVCDYDVLRLKQQVICYGTSPQIVFPIIEFLRQFKFGYVLLDESHSVKNDSSRTKACMALITDIPMKRLASGTMAHDSPSDLAMQISMLDPTLFGSRDEFNERFGDEVKGDRVVKWKPGAQQAIMAAIKSRVVVAGAMRKEWAALLPETKENFHRVELTPAQFAVYSSILQETLEKIKEEAKTNKGLKAFIDNEGEDKEQAADEDAGDSLAALLKPYLARLEQFITAPGRDELGAKLLTGDDLISPKVTKIIERIKLHIDEKLPGKVLIFTNYVNSAEEIFANLPPELKQMSILYTAAAKVENGAAFENDPRYQVMVGVEQSMNTGLNLQFASRLIRTETVWNPGTLEQGNSRVNRPELKKGEGRTNIYYDWIIADKTIDITKISRLISKVIACAKFDNADSTLYDGLEDVPVIPMTLDSIENLNDWSEDLANYAHAYSDYKIIQRDDYASYKALHGELKQNPVAHAPVPKDAKLMQSVPYVPGLELFGANELGLVRLDEYLRSDEVSEAVDEGDEGEEEGEVDPKSKQAQLSALVKGEPVHTEFGDGIIRSLAYNSRVTIDFPSGERTTVKQASTFLITKPDIKIKDIRKALLGQVGDLEVTDKITLPPPRMRKGSMGSAAERKRLALEEIRKDKKDKKRREAMIAELQFSVTNGFLGISYFPNEKTPEITSALQALGFKDSPDFMYAKFTNPQRLLKQFKMWEEAGFTLDKPTNQANNLSGSIKDMYDLLKSGRIKSHNAVYKYSTTNKLNNFYRMELKTSAEKHVFKPFPIIEEGEAFIVLPVRGQAGTRAAMRIKAPGVTWHHSETSVVYYGLNLSKISMKMKEIIEAGIQISNVNDLRKEFMKLKKAKFRDVEAEALGPIRKAKS